MDKNKSLLAVSVVLVIFLVMMGFSSSIQGKEKSYKIKPEITLPEYRSDTARVIDAYERMMDRFIDMTENNMAGINTDVESIAQKLNSIDGKLTDISTRMARIEKALGIEQVEKKTNVTKTNKPRFQNPKR